MKRFVVLGILIVALLVLFRSGALTQQPFLMVTNSVKGVYLDGLTALGDFVEKYLAQAATIDRLKAENKMLAEQARYLAPFASEVKSLSGLKGYTKEIAPKVKGVRVLAYAALPDFHKVWLDYDEGNGSKIYGLLYNDKTAGIVVESDGSQALALLNGAPKCSYAVYVGDEEAPGIVMGRHGEEMIVRYIPAWKEVKVGDEVVTSGLDGIFFPGVAVGKVTKVHKLNAYKEASIVPYYDGYNPDFFYLIERTR